MAELQAGPVTFLFTDIEGSTRLAKRLREQYGEILTEHRELLRTAFRENGGEEIASQGDSFFVCFRRAKHGVAAAAAAQRALQRHEWPGGAEVRVRIGIHTGEAELVDGSYHGVAVNRAARIMAAAQGGEVLMSQTTRDLLEDEVEGLTGLTLRDLGERRLKDLDRPMRLYQLLVADLPRHLVGRQAECERLDQLFADARMGRSGVLVLRGEAGIGKSALCDYAAEHAHGLTVLSAQGVETESELPFSALAELFQPVLGRLDEIPAAQAAALAGALAIGPPVPADRFAACAATLSLLALVADEAPLLVIVDEAQWLDPSSAEALLFVARRLDSEGIALLVAIRDGHQTLFDRAELAEIRLAGLDDEASRALLETHVDFPIAPEIASRLLGIAGGNPLVLVEVPALFSEGQLRGTLPLDDELPRAAGVERAFLRQVQALPEETQQALLVAAASDSGDLDTLVQAIRTIGLEPQALEPAEQAGLVMVNGALRFRHPLLRSAIYETASSVARRSAHQALAEASGEAQQFDRRAWHLASASRGEDEGAAQALEQAALSARQRGGHAEAAGAFERAALLGDEGTKRAARLREAAADAWLLGRADKARELLSAALTGADEPAAHAAIEHLRGAVEMWRGSPMAAHDLLAEEAERIREVDPARAARMLTDAAWASFMAAQIDVGSETARRACELAEEVGGDVEILAKAVRGIALVLAGHSERALPLLVEYAPMLEKGGWLSDAYRPFRPEGQVLIWLEEYERARAVLSRLSESARGESALGALPYALAVLSDLDFRTGNWVAAYAGASEAVRIADETGQTTTLAFSLCCLARIEAAQGREEDCRAHVGEAIAIAEPRIGAVVAFGGAALGLLELGLGRAEDAIEHLEQLAGQIAERGLREPGVIQWAPDLIESYLRAGRQSEAERALSEFEALARKSSRSWALAAAARYRGLLAADDAFESDFERALELHDRTPTPFERARTELSLGERLRRAKKRSEARAPLRSALETFDRLGAAPWAERARTELAATGETARQRNPYAAEQLTPQELQIALIVSRGATNKEAGAALFLSPKTIETHLGRVYRKLNVRSRTELAHLLGSEGELVGAAASD